MISRENLNYIFVKIWDNFEYMLIPAFLYRFFLEEGRVTMGTR